MGFPELEQQPVFAFSTGAPQLVLGSGQRSRVSKAQPQLGALSLGAVASTTFTTRGSAVAQKQLISKSALKTSQRRALPFASMTLAAVTMAKPAVPAPSATPGATM